MRPGAKGSAAIFNSTRMKSMNNGKDTQSDTMVTGAFHESLLPRSRPRRIVKIAHTSTRAPRKSTRFSLVFQSELSILGNFRTSRTTTNAKAQRGTWPKKALFAVSAYLFYLARILPTIANPRSPPEHRLLGISDVSVMN